MPNHIMNRLRLSGDQSRIDELLESVKGEDTVLDFNKVIPMPESLRIESGSRTNNGLKAYKDFVYVYTFAGTEEKDLLNIPKEKEEIFLTARPDIKRDEWNLGRAAFQNEQKYGAATWYECYAKLCITLVMNSNLKCTVFKKSLIICYFSKKNFPYILKKSIIRLSR